MKTSNTLLRNESGATIVYVALIIAVLVMFTAIAIDIGHLSAVRNELQDAADAGALAGASALLDPETCELQADYALDEAKRVTELNTTTGKVSVVAKSVQVGHWSFNSPTPNGHVFTADLNDPHVQIEWKEQTAAQLDADTGYINAVEVVTERADTPSFFASFFGFDQFLVNTKAVAYRGFAGSFRPGDFDQPVAICWEAISDPETHTHLKCNAGRMINSGNDPSSSNTAGWTNFTQPCDTANKPTVDPLICASGNTNSPETQKGIGTTGGEVQNLFEHLLTCWTAATKKIRNWPLTLPIVLCPGNNVSNCAKFFGAVSLNVIWMIDKFPEAEEKKYDDAPTTMTVYDEDNKVVKAWSNNDPVGLNRWMDFVDKFGLKNADGRPDNTNGIDTEGYKLLYQHKAIFFLPNCEFAQALGGNGGSNTGVCSRESVLVK